MKSTKRLEKKIEANTKKMIQLYNENIDLRDQINIRGNYSEKEELFQLPGQRKKTTHLIGRNYWKDDFVDGDTGEVVSIDRSRICRIDGKPCDRFGNVIEHKTH